MMMKSTIAAVLMFSLLTLTSCSNNGPQISDAINARGTLFAKIIGAVEKDPTVSGMADGRKIFDSEKAAAKAKWDAAKGLKLSDKERSQLTGEQSDEFQSTLSFQKKHPMEGTEREQFLKLIDDFNTAFTLN